MRMTENRSSLCGLLRERIHGWRSRPTGTLGADPGRDDHHDAAE
jgi:hypothetical protein